MTNYIDETDRKQKQKRERAFRKKLNAPKEPHAQPGAKQMDEVRVPVQVWYGDQGDFEDGTIKD